MNKILVFAGTTEGRTLSEWLCERNTDHTLCIATEYGEQVLHEHPCAHVKRGRMDEKEIEAFITANDVKVVVDATHPYAQVVTDNIKQAAENTSILYLRLDRNKSFDTSNEEAKAQCEKYYFADTKSCAEALKETKGNILLTTGSKELHIYAGVPEVKDRLVARVLPGRESIELCEKAGILGKNIIAMQGPFSLEMNLALIKAYNIELMVSKLSGKTGGYDSKENAAAIAKIPMYIVGRPDNSSGLSFAEVCQALRPYMSEAKVSVSLIGCGMGHKKHLTVEALEALEKAEIVFGAKRLIEDCDIKKESYPYYLAKDIIPVLKEKNKDAAVLFSGDSGFCSGTAKMFLALKEQCPEFSIKVYPGISSFSNLAAAFGLPYEDAKIMTIHGKGTKEDWGGKLLKNLKENKKTFILLSGVKDLNTIGEMLIENAMDSCLIYAGYQMGGEKEKYLILNPQECKALSEEGLYSIFVVNPDASSALVSYGVPDETFIRGKVPMTKEEIRALSISKLKLRRDSVVYDVGAGTGSVSVEIANTSSDIKLYAIETNIDGVELIKENAKAFGLTNLTVINGLAPEALTELPAPTHAFIGGSKGNLKEIIRVIFDKNPEAIIVANAVSLETLEELKGLEDEFELEDYSLIQVAVTRTKKLGHYHMLQSENPIWICSFKGKGC